MIKIDKIKNYFVKYLHLIIIIGVWLVLVFANYTPNTWLTGWDNLHPELFPINDIYRSVNSLWQEYQGMGLLGGMGHAADLPRQILVLILSLFLNPRIVRYLLLFSSLLIGAVGAFYLCKKLIKQHDFSVLSKSWITSLITALFYLLNIATVQNFYTPFEPFYVFFAFLPWLIYILLNCLERGEKKDYLLFFVIGLLASPMGYIQTNYVVYCLMIGIILFCFLIKNPKKNFSKTIKPVIITLLSNIFWLVPVLIFVISGDSAITVNSHINSISTPEVIIRNQQYGNIQDILQMKGYWFSLMDQAKPGEYQYLMQPWINHQSLFAYSIFWAIIMLIGVTFFIIKSIQKRTFNYQISGLLFGLIAIILILAGENSIFGFLWKFLIDKVGIIEQIFRSPFTKVVVPFSLYYSIFVGGGVFAILSLVEKAMSKFSSKILERIINLFILLSLMISLFIYSAPTWQGNFIYREMRREIPNEYLAFFDFAKEISPNKRAALLPLNSMWGWERNNWSYRGIGIWWHGMSQPLMNRAFDVWSVQNEMFYKEMSREIAQKNTDGLRKVLEKYGIEILILDNSIIDAADTNQLSNRIHQENIDYALESIDAQQIFSQGNIAAWEIKANEENYLTSSNNFLTTNLEQNLTTYDYYYQTEGEYINGKSENEIVFPFQYILDSSKKNVFSYKQNTDDTEVTYQANLSDLKAEDYNLTLPNISQELLTKININYTEQALNFEFILPFYLKKDNGEKIFEYETLTLNTMTDQEATSSVIVNLGDDVLYLPKDGSSISKLVKIDFSKNLNINYFALEEANQIEGDLIISPENNNIIELNEDFWNPWRETIVADLKKSDGLNISFLSSAENFEIDPESKTSNCDQLQRGEVYKNKNNQRMELFANNMATNCESVIYPRSKLNTDYLLRLKGENISGKGLSLYLYNVNHSRADLEELINTEGAFDQTFAIPGWRSNLNSNVSKFAYSLNFNVQSLAGEPANSIIDKYDLYPVNLEWANKVLINNGTLADIENSNHLDILETKKFGTSHYYVKVSGQGLLELKQGYHRFWNARSSNQLPNLISFWLPSVWGDKIDHKMVNSTTNGWLIDEKTCEDKENCWIIVYFWPQYLGWVALGITGLSLIIFPLLVLPKKKRPIK